MREPNWIIAGGWRRVDANTPDGVILETVELVFDHIPAEAALRSLREGVWHWEPEGCPCASPSHWRPWRGKIGM